MWKREEEQQVRPAVPVPQAVASAEPPRVASTRTSGGATIGPSIVVKGEVTGDEDLFIHGQVDGSVALDLHSVTVGNVGRVKANISGRVITIEGVVEGNLRAQEQIILRGSANVQGDLKAPRIVLEDGATFRGLIDMGAQKAPPAPSARVTAIPSPVPTDAPPVAAAKPETSPLKEAPKSSAPPASKSPTPTGAGR